MTSDGTATQNPGQTITGTTQTTTPPGGAPVITSLPPAPPPTSTFEPMKDQDDPNKLGVAPPPQPVCTDAQKAYNLLQLRIENVDNAYGQWDSAYISYQSSKFYNGAILAASLTGSIASVVGDLITGGAESAVLGAIKVFGPGTATSTIKAIVEGESLTVNIANFLNALNSVIQFVKTFDKSSLVTASGRFGFWSGMLSIMNTALSTSLTLRGMASLFGLVNAVGVGSVASVLGTVGDFFDVVANYNERSDAVTQGQMNYEKAMNSYRQELAAYMQIQSECGTDTDDGPDPTDGDDGGDGDSDGEGLHRSQRSHDHRLRPPRLHHPRRDRHL